jgi:hypothetical protein
MTLIDWVKYKIFFLVFKRLQNILGKTGNILARRHINVLGNTKMFFAIPLETVYYRFYNGYTGEYCYGSRYISASPYITYEIIYLYAPAPIEEG